MILKDQIQNLARKAIEHAPDAGTFPKLIRNRTPLLKRFAADGIVPNNPKLPVIIYRQVLSFSKEYDPAVLVDHMFASNDWGRSWRDSIYDFVHYHSQTHEVLGVAKGHAMVELGGVMGSAVGLKAGDVVILPAGTGHRLIEASKDFLVVGAYPEDGTYDECTDSRDKAEAIKRIAKVKLPRRDPVYGAHGPLKKVWKSH